MIDAGHHADETPQRFELIVLRSGLLTPKPMTAAHT